MYKLGPIKRKILLTLAGSVALGFSRNSNQYFRTFRRLRKEWSRTSQYNFNRSIYGLSKDKLVEEKILLDGTFKLVLTKTGKEQAKKLSLLGAPANFKKSKRWDGLWRIVIFDIPELDRLFRAIFREHLYTLDFYKLQNSVFVSPHPCEKSILDLVELYGAKRNVRVITATKIDNEKFLKKHFSI